MTEYRRFDFNKDSKEVVSLINACLNPAYTKEYLFWKHFENPLGTSTGAVATISSKIVAVVFYIPYNVFSVDNESIKGARPVDGCTHKDFRGKGIFKKLMNYCLNQFHYKYDFLFANPNKFSYPEFIKMGWDERTGYQYMVGFVNPVFKKKRIIELNYEDITNQESKFSLSREDVEFLKWRFKNPRYLFKKFSIDNEIIYIVYRIQKIKNIKTLILCTFLGNSSKINDSLKEICRNEQVYLVYFLNGKITSELNFLWKRKVKKAVIVFKENIPGVLLDANFSLTDMERTT